jgi:hypothetical protein
MEHGGMKSSVLFFAGKESAAPPDSADAMSVISFSVA